MTPSLYVSEATLDHLLNLADRHCDFSKDTHFKRPHYNKTFCNCALLLCLIARLGSFCLGSGKLFP